MVNNRMKRIVCFSGLFWANSREEGCKVERSAAGQRRHRCIYLLTSIRESLENNHEGLRKTPNPNCTFCILTNRCAGIADVFGDGLRFHFFFQHLLEGKRLITRNNAFQGGETFPAMGVFTTSLAGNGDMGESKEHINQRTVVF